MATAGASSRPVIKYLIPVSAFNLKMAPEPRIRRTAQGYSETVIVPNILSHSRHRLSCVYHCIYLHYKTCFSGKEVLFYLFYDVIFYNICKYSCWKENVAKKPSSLPN